MNEAKDRLRRVFLFLKERSKLDSPVERTLDKDAWQLRISELPSHPLVSGALLLDTFDYGEERGDVVLEVRRPSELQCPEPGLSIRDHLQPGWEKLDCEEPLLVPELADNDPRRPTSFLLWKNLRDEWRTNEIPNRTVIAAYEQLFALRARLQRESERFRILLGDGWLHLDHPDGAIAHPLLLQELELELEEKLPALRLRIAHPIPELNTALLRTLPEIESASIAHARELVEQKSASLHDPDGVAELIAKVANLLFPKATLAQSPIIFLGKRAGTIPLAVDRFIDALPAMDDLPRPLVDVVLDNPQEPITDPGLACEPLFTLPANREQEEILRRLERNGSVVVQGPPGTGKTHTIANLIGHFLAEGKTVLVTSHTAKALRVVRDKVVPELQPLCVAYLESDLRGREQLESSVNGIVARLSLPDADARAIARVSDARAKIVAELDATEQGLDRALATEVDPLVVGGRAFLPKEAAERLRAGFGRDDWIEKPITRGAVLPLSIAEVHQLYQLQVSLPSSDEAAVSASLPPVASVFDPRAYEALIRELNVLENDPRADDAAVFRTPMTVAQLEPVVARAIGAVEWLTGEQWLARCLDDVSRGGTFLATWEELREMISAALDAHEQMHAESLRHDLVAPSIADGLELCDQLIAHLREGGGLGWFARLSNKAWVSLLEGARIDGRAPESIEDFTALRAVYAFRSLEAALRKRWAKQMVSNGSADLPDSAGEWPNFLELIEQKIARAKLWWTHEQSKIERELVAAGMVASLVDARLPEDARQNVTRRALLAVTEVLVPALEALKRRERCAELQGYERRMALPIKKRDVEAYARAYARLVHLHAQRAQLSLKRSLLARLSPVAPSWALALEGRTAGALPANIEDAWMHAQLSMEISSRLEIDLDAIQKKVVELRDRLHEKTAELVACKAWAKQVERTTPSARRKLTGWLDYQKQIGKGTGKRAPMLQRKALELLSECKDSVPVWIMPLSKVIESYDLARTRFDVVIIDEASQCDVNGLFAFGLARQIVVVGDDQQVSPLAVGQELDPIQSLIDLHLDGIPNKDLYTGRLSIYDLARQSQSAIRLREHFRCVPEIIAFSSKLAYDGEIQALRDETSATIAPAVIEHRVAGKCDEQNVNNAEAIEVAALVAACVEQPEYADASMGVISLLGDAQWGLIERFLHAWLEPKEIERRRLLCGAPAHFQGDERDVLFMSMVWSGGGASPLNMNDNPELKKRINVAASRARDQMWLVHSLNADSDLKPGDLRRRLIDHAAHPSSSLDGRGGALGRDSELARGVRELLAARGFRVKPQWKVGSYQLDLVVEGEKGRAAIECLSGDRVGQRELDRARREQLSRLGWRFIRVRGSAFALDPAQAIEGIVHRLRELSIDPLGPSIPPVSATLDERVKKRAAELRQAIWDRLGEAESSAEAKAAPKKWRRQATRTKSRMPRSPRSVRG